MIYSRAPELVRRQHKGACLGLEAAIMSFVAFTKDSCLLSRGVQNSKRLLYRNYLCFPFLRSVVGSTDNDHIKGRTAIQKILPNTFGLSIDLTELKITSYHS